MAYNAGMLVSIVETDSYLSKALKVMPEAEMEAVVSVIWASPMAGDFIQGTSGMRKLRIPVQRRGKNEASDLSPGQKKQLVGASEAFTRQFRSVK
jgi:hypothetical protein